MCIIDNWGWKKRERKEKFLTNSGYTFAIMSPKMELIIQTNNTKNDNNEKFKQEFD